ncbi:uncharacterized protein LOC134217875 isoform X1 [Armigeres subalbatus]|uniref:uncharacterized protein LOC134217875 isoform X1 n=1 Tax=Armigeres subalbatus TaxID=124917 RepID=UPI002ED2B225
MSFNFGSLPLKIVQLIFEHLTLDDLLSASLVCREWYSATDAFITQKGWLALQLDQPNILTKLEGIRRRYSNLLLSMVPSFGELLLIIDVCAEKFNLRRLKINRTSIDNIWSMFFLLGDFKTWVNNLDEVHILLDHRFLQNDNHITGRKMQYEIQLTAARCLHWSEIHTGKRNRAITVFAPRLKLVSISDSIDSIFDLELPDCHSLETLECTLYKKKFENLYKASFEHLTTLVLRIHYTVQDVHFLHALTKLKWLTLSVKFDKRLLETLFVETTNAINSCSDLEGLQLIIMGDTASSSINLYRLSESLPRLKQLELNNMYLSCAGNTSLFDQLITFKLVNVKLKEDDDILEMSYPSLQTISLNVKLLPSVNLLSSKKVELFVNVDSLDLAESVDLYLNPFLNQFYSNIRTLTLFKSGGSNTRVDSVCPRNALGVPQLNLINMTVSLEILEIIASSGNLTHLTLSKCLLSIQETFRMVLLKNLHVLEVRQVQLSDRKEVLFPLLTNNREELRGRLQNGSIWFNTAGDDDGLSDSSCGPANRK